MIKNLFSRYFELAFWVVALVSLAFINPSVQSHFTLCPLKGLGITWCPGCGLGHSIAFLFHGELKRSFNAHWLGLPAFFVILNRIYVLGREKVFFNVSIHRNHFFI